MHKALQIFVLILLCLIITLALAACNGGESVGGTESSVNDDVSDDDGNVGEEHDGGSTDVEDAKNFENIRFENKTVVYDTKPHTITAEGLPEGSEVVYLTPDSYADAGEYTLKIRVSKNGYEDYEGEAVLTIRKGEAFINLSKVKTEFVYNSQKQYIQGAEGSGEISYENNGFVDAGSYAVTVKCAETKNYEAGSTIVNVTVAKAIPPAVVFPQVEELVYGELLDESRLSGGVGIGDFTIENVPFYPSVATKTVNVIFTPSDTRNYDYSSINRIRAVAVVIKPKPLGVRANPEKINYGEIPVAEYTLEGFIPGEDESVLTKRPIPRDCPTDAGEYPEGISFYGAEADNYTFDYQSASLTILPVKLESPEPEFAEGKIVWNEVENADSYIVNINGFPYGADDCFFTLNEKYDYTLCKVSVAAISNSRNFTDSVQSESLIRLAAPKNLRREGTVFNWDCVEGADYYGVFINGTEYRSNASRFDADALPAGENTIYVRAKSNSGDVYASAKSATCTAVKLTAPQPYIRSGKLTWEENESAQEYMLTIDGVFFKIPKGGNVFDFAGCEPKTYTVSMMSVGGENYISSEYSKPLEIVKLPEIGLHKFKNGVLSWNCDSNEYRFCVETNGASVILDRGVYNFDLSEIAEETIVDIINYGGNDAINSDTTRLIVSADEVKLQHENLYYRALSDDSVLICGVADTTVTEIVIPDYIKGLKVCAIAPNSLSACKNLAELSLPYAGVGTLCLGQESLPVGALFSDTLSEGYELVKQIPTAGSTEQKYYIPSSLRRVKISSGAISYGAFMKCVNLESVVIGDSVATVAERAFDGCEKLTFVKFGSGVVSLGKRAFNDCSSLSDVQLPGGLIDMGAECFRNCSSLISVSAPTGVGEIGDKAFLNCTSLKQVCLSETIQAIGMNAFQNCSSLEEIFLPASIARIGGNAFRDCTSLTEIRFATDTLEGIVLGTGWNTVKGNEIPYLLNCEN